MSSRTTSHAREREWISLGDAVMLICRERQQHPDEAQTELQGALLDGQLTARGVGLAFNSGLPTAREFITAARAGGDVPWAEWHSHVDWGDGRVGRFLRVQIQRAALLTWLGTERSLGIAEERPPVHKRTAKPSEKEIFEWVRDWIAKGHSAADSVMAKASEERFGEAVVRKVLRAAKYQLPADLYDRNGGRPKNPARKPRHK